MSVESSVFDADVDDDDAWMVCAVGGQPLQPTAISRLPCRHR